MTGYRSLRARLITMVLAVVAIGLTIAAVVFVATLRASLRDDATAVAQERAEARAAVLGLEGGELGARDQATLDRLTSDPVWVVRGGGITGRAPRDAALRDGVIAVARDGRARSVAGVRLAATPLIVDGRERGTVVAGLSERVYDRTLRIAALGAVALVAVTLLALALAAWWLLRSALGPVATMTRDAERWSEADADQRFGLGPPRDELTGLAATLDGLLDRLSAALRHERHLTAEISHELRTPLARIVAHAETGSAADGTGSREAFHAILRSAGQMDATLSGLLAAGRASRDGGTCVVADAVAAAAAGARDLDGHVAVAVVAPAGHPRAAAAAVVVERALAPLLDNAVRHARDEVAISFWEEGSVVTVEVADDGPGVPREHIDRVFTPGERLPGATHAGSGLGLPLARRLARAAGGDVTAHPGPGGRFRLTLPRAHATPSASDQVRGR